jgi:hypothetical protein
MTITGYRDGHLQNKRQIVIKTANLREKSHNFAHFRGQAMDILIGGLLLGGKVAWQFNPHRPQRENDEGFEIVFSWSGETTLREATKLISELLTKNDVSFLKQQGKQWIFDPTAFRQSFLADGSTPAHQQFADSVSWIERVLIVEPVHSSALDDRGRSRSRLEFSIYREDYLLNKKSRLFLSHRGADKPMVRRFYSTLKLLGFDPWLDEEDIAGGAELHRALQQGMKDSCAAIFFITPQFTDEKYLRGELNLAVQEKTEKGDRFTILALAMKDDKGEKGSVPDLLHQWVWKEPENELQALSDIIRAIPIQVGPPSWKPGI